MNLLWSPDLLKTVLVPGVSASLTRPEVYNIVTDNSAKLTSMILFICENITIFVNLITQLIYLFFYYSGKIPFSEYPFFQLLTNFSWFVITRTICFELFLIFVHNWEQLGVFLAIPMFLDLFGDFFRCLMVFLMALNRMNVFANYKRIAKLFKKWVLKTQRKGEVFWKINW